MAPVKKQQSNKKSKLNEKKEQNIEAVVSGQLQKKINKKNQRPPKDPKGVVFIKHLPHGFFEEQLKNYFEQFGNVTRIRLARCRRTGNSKGYAFVEFEYPEVAEVAAETMDNYLMFKKIVKASYIPPEKQQFNYFRTSVKKIRNKSGKSVWVSGKTASIQQKMKKHNDWSEENYQKRIERQLEKINKIGQKYAHLGIDINKIIVQPKILKEEEKELQEKSKPNGAKEEKKDAGSKGIKRKTCKEVISPIEQNTKKFKNKVSLEDLLGNSLPEDSEDEDFAASDIEDGSEKSEESSDEETYCFPKDSDYEDENHDSSISATKMKTLSTSQKKSKNLKKNSKNKNSDNEDEVQDDSQNSSDIFQKKKIVRASNVDRFDQMLKRKPLAGGINKLNKKPLKQPVRAKKASLQITAAKELAKPLSKIKGKISRPLKGKKSIKIK